MVNTKDLQVKALLNGAGKAGPELTHSLSELGGGKMADGLVELWKSGQKSGIVKGATITTLAFSAVIGSYVLIKNAIEDRRIKKALEEIDISATNRPLETPLAVDGGEHIAPTEVHDGEG